MKKEIIFVLIAIAMLWVGMQDLDHHVSSWLDPVVKEGELEGAKWVKENLPQDSLFVAGIFGGELIMGISGRRSLVGGDWAANPDSPAQMADVEKAYVTDSANEVESIMLNYNASYVWFPSRDVYAGYGWKKANEEKMNDPRFEIIYSNGEVRIYKLRKST